MKKIEEIMSVIDIHENYYSSMSKHEKEEIYKKVVGSKKKYKYKKKILLIAAAMIVLSTTAFAFAHFEIDKQFKEYLSITKEYEEEISDGTQNTPYVISHDGVSISVLQTISDGKCVYFIVEAEFANNITLTDNCNFENISVIPEDDVYGAFGTDVNIIEQSSNKRKYLISSNGNANLETGKYMLVFENLCQDNLSDKTLINGVWDIDFNLDANIHTVTKEKITNTKVTAYLNNIQDYKTVNIKKITLSPLSLSIDVFSERAKNGSDNIFATYVKVNMKNGESFYCGKNSIKKNYSGNIEGGNMFFKFDKVINIDEVESISVGDKTIMIK